MIQIFFNQSDRGPGKVIDNFLTGLKQSGENYICNPLDIETDEKAICLNGHPIIYSNVINYFVDSCRS